jgi:hypothetical protein
MLYRISQTVYRILSSRKFFVVVIALFLIQALWFVFTAVYPMAFDENFHFGIIQIYAHQWSPILMTTPPGSSQYGELLHDPSYLFQYLMSFPYRFTTLFTHNQTIEIIVLRIIDVTLFTGGIIAFRKLLGRVGLSKALTNFALLMFVLIPVVPFLAATINYDNLLFLTVPIYLLIVMRAIDSIKNHRFSFTNLALLVSVGTLGSLVKYAFLPIFGITIVYLLIVWLKTRPRTHLPSSIAASFRSAKLYVKLGLLVLALIGLGLFLQRYAVNFIEYHSIEPDCSKIESLNECLQYGPWARNYNAEIKAQMGAPHNPILPLFLPAWFGGMILRLYFAINSNFANVPPPPLPIYFAGFVGLVGTVLAVIYRRSIIKSIRYSYLLLGVALAYLAALFYVNLTQYLHFHEMVAINGRYLIPILVLLFVFVSLAFREFIMRHVPKNKRLIVMAGVAVIVVLIILQGGGILTYLAQSDTSWYWSNDPLTGFTLAIGNFVRHLIIGG